MTIQGIEFEGYSVVEVDPLDWKTYEGIFDTQEELILQAQEIEKLGLASWIIDTQFPTGRRLLYTPVSWLAPLDDTNVPGLKPAATKGR